MALLNCKECGNQVSTKAKNCPKCGAKAPEEPITPLRAVLSLLGIGFLIFIIHGCIKATKLTPAEQAAEDAKQATLLAAYACGDSIKENLNDPDSAKFDYDHATYITKTKGNTTTWTITIPTRAKNPFNATISALFQCEVKKVGDDDPKTLRVTQIE